MAWLAGWLGWLDGLAELIGRQLGDPIHVGALAVMAWLNS
jgi:hypothetical protein